MLSTGSANAFDSQSLCSRCARRSADRERMRLLQPLLHVCAGQPHDVVHESAWRQRPCCALRRSTVGGDRRHPRQPGVPRVSRPPRRLLDQVPRGVDPTGQLRRRHLQGQEQPGSHRCRPGPHVVGGIRRRTADRAQANYAVAHVHRASVVRIGASTAIRARYTTESAPNPVTGKRVTLIVDRYELGRGGRVAVVDLGTAVGVDNVDAYRMMIRSFTWR